MLLFKYGKDDTYLRENLFDYRLWFSVPGRFNDLNDSALSLAQRLTDEDIRTELAPQLRALALRERVLLSRLAQVTEMADVIETVELLTTLSQTKQVLTDSVNDAIADRGPDGTPDQHGAHRRQMEEALKYRRTGEDKSAEVLAQPEDEKISSSIGISCFSKDCDNHNLWGVYGDNHKGVCIAVESDNDNVCFQELREVVYEDTLPKLGAMTTENLIKLYSTKHARWWAHECEVRAFQHRAGSHKIDRRCLVGVFFGVRATKETITGICDIVRDRYGPPRVPLFQMCLDENLKLRPESLDPVRVFG
jgi:hypothetical protein